MKKTLVFMMAMLVFGAMLFAQDTGGPDDFGYTFANSNAASGPTFSWITPSTANDLVDDLSDDTTQGPYPIGFDFPYYDGVYDEFWLCSNGWISFTSTTNSDRTPEAIPNTTVPNNQISWMWMDLDPAVPDTVECHVYSENLTEDNSLLLTFFQYNEYPDNSGEWVTAQMRLYPNGDILMQYDEFTEAFPLVEAGVGIENGDGTIGLQYCMQDSTMLYDDLALLFSYPEGVDNDLALHDMTGETVVAVNAEETYTVSVRNRGNNAQSTYSVKLWQEGDVLLDEVTGPAVDPDEIVTVDLTWNPGADGPTYIWSEVVLAGDEAPENNVGDTLDVNVLPEGVVASVIGDGDLEDNDYPVNMFYKNSLSQMIYFPDEIGQAGSIYAISWFNNYTSDDCVDQPIKIWMDYTDEDSLTAGFIPATDMTLVFEGNIDFPFGMNEIMIPLDNPFMYDGASNLVVFTERVMDDEYFDSTDDFINTETPDRPGRTIEKQSDTIDYDPFNPPDEWDVHDNVANTVLYIDTSSIITGASGYVRDINSTPIVGATITASPGGMSTTSIEDGVFLLELAPGNYELTASMDGYQDQTVDNVAVIENTITPDVVFVLELEGVTGVTGSVRLPDNTAIAGATITATPGGQTATTGDDGIYTLELAAGTYSLTASKEGYLDDTANDVVVTENNLTSMHFTLVPVATVTFTVTCNDGDAPTGAELTLANGVDTFEETLDNTGVVTFDNVPLAEYNLTVTLDTYDDYTDTVTISENASLNVTLLETLVTPGNLDCTDEGFFTWDAPARQMTRKQNNIHRQQTASRDLVNYQVYLDGSLVATVTEPEYQFEGLVDDQTYTAGVRAVYTAGSSEIVTVDFTYDEVGVNGGDAPLANQWKGNYPNPFNPSTTLRFSLREAQEVRIDIYNMRGQKVCTLINEQREAGEHVVVWDGRDEQGRQQASGVYMGRLQASSFSSTFKMIMMK